MNKDVLVKNIDINLLAKQLSDLENITNQHLDDKEEEDTLLGIEELLSAILLAGGYEAPEEEA